MGVKCTFCSLTAMCTVKFEYSSKYWLCREHFYWMLVSMQNSLPFERAIIKWE